METEAANMRKRPLPERFRRSKRGKYASVACNECKKRKLKCISTDDSVGCQRCVREELVCIYALCVKQTAEDKNDSNLRALSDAVQQLRHKVSALENDVALVKDIRENFWQSSKEPSTPDTGAVVDSRSPASSLRDDVPKEPQFVGPTRSAFGIILGERTLTCMGIPLFDQPPPSNPQSPVPDDSSSSPGQDYWQAVTAEGIARLLIVFQEEVESVYPILNIGEQAAQAAQILQAIRQDAPAPGISRKDVQIAQVAVATALVLETHGQREPSATIVQSVERDMSFITQPKVNLQDIQLSAILSIYYFHCDDELLAWRTIGMAARGSLEMGLHRRQSLLDNFPGCIERRLATRVFWCIYALDRRWSFGTSLSFALVDRDIDPDLPEPGDEFSFLQCMVGYGRLCSKLWDVIPHFGSRSQSIPTETVDRLDHCIRDWMLSIPPDLQLRHPRLGLAPLSQPRVVHRLRALLYLRGNHTRTLLYRHHLLSASSISAACPGPAQLVVDIARDSIEVLVHLHATSDIYSRQQTAFHYFLLSALSIVFLAVCHAPDVFFARPCSQSFLDAVDLVRGFSHNSLASRRLWNSIRGLLPRLKSLGLSTSTTGPLSGYSHAPYFEEPTDHHALADAVVSNVGLPDIFPVSNELLSLFDALGQGHMQDLSTV